MNIAAIETIENFFGWIFQRESRKIISFAEMRENLLNDSLPLRKF